MPKPAAPGMIGSSLFCSLGASCCAAHVQAIGQGFPGQLGIFSDKHTEGLTGLASAIRAEGSLAVAAFASAQGAHVIRAHDVEATVRVVRMIDAIRET